MMYGSETWAVKEEDVCRFERTKIRMVNWISNTTLKNRTSIAELRGHFGIEGTGKPHYIIVQHAINLYANHFILTLF